MITQGDIQGHWRRRWLRAPGHEDTTTRVHWLQSGQHYADIRVPLARPDPGAATRLADLPNAALLELMQAEGFAGTTDVADSVCTWTRAINWHGATQDVDAGRLSFDAAGDLIEDGVHATYAELWARGDDTGTRAWTLTGAGRMGYLVTVRDRFVLAIGQSGAPASAPLRAALDEDVRPEEDLARFFDAVYCFGQWDGAVGHVSLSTNPFLEGTAALAQSESHLRFFHQGFHGAPESLSFEARLAP